MLEEVIFYDPERTWERGNKKFVRIRTSKSGKGRHVVLHDEGIEL